MLNALPGRRRAMIGLAALAATPALGAVEPALPDGALLLVAGPPGGRVDRWADALTPPLGRVLPSGTALTRQNVGGADGVTGANKFEALAVPDGATALLVPGSAALSWLAGDSRVQFDAARWVPVWAGNTGAVVVSKVRLTPGRPIRLAAPGLIGPELAGLLALDLMGVGAVPVAPAVTLAEVLARPDIDAVFLAGGGLRSTAPLQAAGMQPVLGFGETPFPGLLTASEAVANAEPGLAAALRAVTAAALMDVALVLPQLSPASAVALWRRGCATLAQAQSVQTEAARTGTRPTAAPLTIAADVPTLLDLRRWLAARHGWRPA